MAACRMCLSRCQPRRGLSVFLISGAAPPPPRRLLAQATNGLTLDGLVSILAHVSRLGLGCRRLGGAIATHRRGPCLGTLVCPFMARRKNTHAHLRLELGFFALACRRRSHPLAAHGQWSEFCMCWLNMCPPPHNHRNSPFFPHIWALNALVGEGCAVNVAFGVRRCLTRPRRPPRLRIMVWSIWTKSGTTPSSSPMW